MISFFYEHIQVDNSEYTPPVEKANHQEAEISRLRKRILALEGELHDRNETLKKIKLQETKHNEHQKVFTVHYQNDHSLHSQITDLFPHRSRVIIGNELSNAERPENHKM